MEFSCKEFKVGKCEGERLVEGETIPLVLRPPAEDKNQLEVLLEGIGKNKDWFHQMIAKNSAVLLRGFDVKNAVDFNDVVEAFGWDEIRYVGPAPRTQVHKRIWTANEGDLSEFIHYHHEMLSVKVFPEKVILFCEVAPPHGGETPFIPSFRVTERMLEEFPEFVEELDKKGLKYTFKVLGKKDSSSTKGRGWENAFGTSDKAEAEKKANALGFGVEWLPEGGVKTILGPLSLTRVFEERKGRRMWFNTVVGMHRKEVSNVTMADGTEIPEKIVKRCSEILEEESIQFKWEKGDVLFLDNYALLHGRRPSLPPRKVLAALCK
ncbi:hypothetical protein ABFS83_04G129500 [Erythranthe nasuta]